MKRISKNLRKPWRRYRKLISTKKFKHTKTTRVGIKSGRISTIYRVRSHESNWTLPVKTKRLPRYLKRSKFLRLMSVIRAGRISATISTNRLWKESRMIWQELERHSKNIHSSYQIYRLPSTPWAR